MSLNSSAREIRSAKPILDSKSSFSPLDRKIKATGFFSSSADRKKELSFTLRQFAGIVPTRHRPKKEALPWIKLGRFGETKSKKGSFRHDKNVNFIDGIEGDYDGGEIPMSDAAKLLQAANIAALFYESPSATSQNQRWRVLCPCSHSKSKEERLVLMARLNGALDGILATESFTLSQSFYFGNVDGTSPRQTILVDGRYIDCASDLDAKAIGRHAKLSGGGETLERTTDESGSGAAFRKAMELLLNNGTIEDFEAWAVEHPWGDYERNPERAVKRTWESAGIEAGKVALSQLRDPLDFEDISEDGEKPRTKVTLKDLPLSNLDAANGADEFVEGIFSADSFSCVFGAPSAGKTFFLLNLALHVACNRPWNGRGVEQSGVLYVALEGAGGFSKRLKAWCQHYGVSDLALLPFHAMVGSFDMRNDKTTTRAIVETAKAKAALWKKPVRLIVVDTLARAMAGGDENSAQDMGAIIAIVDSIRLATGANVCLVHHSGKDDSRGARGSNALLGAVTLKSRLNVRGFHERQRSKNKKMGRKAIALNLSSTSWTLG
jgi:AAA domain